MLKPIDIHKTLIKQRNKEDKSFDITTWVNSIINEISSDNNVLKRLSLSPINRNINKFSFDILDTKDIAIYYDYTPNIQRAIRYKNHPIYTVAFSRKESNAVETKIAFNEGINTAVVFNKLPKVWMGKKVIDGDKNFTIAVSYTHLTLPTSDLV